MRVLVSGGAGFVGRTLCPALVAAGHSVVATTRSLTPPPATDGITWKTVGDLGPDADWTAALEGVEAVVHCAARVHVMRDTAADPEAENLRANADGTRRLAEQAAAAGVNRFVFLSSIKAMGEATPPDAPFTEDTPPKPVDPYGRAKWAAEQGLAEIAARSPLEPVILRPPLVYGPGVKGNFESAMRAVTRGLPLPLASVLNRRSLLFVGNLVDAVGLCLTHPAAAGRTYLLRDGEDLSTADLMRRIGAALGRPARLLPMPPGVLRLAGKMIGREAAVERLLDSLAVDDGRLRRDLGWTPPHGVDAGLAATVAWFRATANEDGRNR